MAQAGASRLPYAHTLVWCRPNCGGAWPGGARRRRALVDMTIWRRATCDVRGNRQILLPPQAAAYATSRSHLKVYCTKSKPTSRRHATPSVTLAAFYSILEIKMYDTPVGIASEPLKNYFGKTSRRRRCRHTSRHALISEYAVRNQNQHPMRQVLCRKTLPSPWKQRPKSKSKKQASSRDSKRASDSYICPFSDFIGTIIVEPHCLTNEVRGEVVGCLL